MARHLKLAYIYLSTLLLVSQLAYCQDRESNENKVMSDIEELLGQLKKAAKERREMSDDKSGDASGQEQTTEQTPDVDFQKKKGVNINDVKVDGELKERIIQDCDHRYELLIDKDLDKEEGKCFLRKMNDIVYNKNCKEKGNEGELNITYEVGAEIKNKTILSMIKDSEPCNDKPLYEMVQSSVEKRSSDGYGKRLADKRYCYCGYYYQYCYPYCVQYSYFWGYTYCAQYYFSCQYYCGYTCY